MHSTGTGFLNNHFLVDSQERGPYQHRTNTALLPQKLTYAPSLGRSKSLSLSFSAAYVDDLVAVL